MIQGLILTGQSGTITGELPEEGSPLRKRKIKIAIVAARFNEPVTQRLMDGARATLERRGIGSGDIQTVWVPGSFEIPLAAQTIAKKKKVDAIICLGAIIQGETMHHALIAREVTRGLGRIALKYEVPVIMGIITAESWQQALDRSGGKVGNRGAEAAVTALEMIGTLQKLKS